MLKVLVLLFFCSCSLCSQSDPIDRYKLDTVVFGDLRLRIHNAPSDIVLSELIVELYGDTVLHLGDTKVSEGGAHVSIGIEHRYIWKQEHIPTPLLTDINKNGLKDLVIHGNSGGASCCHSMVIYEETKSGRINKIYDGPEKSMGYYKLYDIDNDGTMEIILKDDVFAYFDYNNAYSSPIQITEKWDGRKYKPVRISGPWTTDDEYYHGIDEAAFIDSLDFRADDIFYSDFWCLTKQERNRMAPYELWGNMCTLISIGRCDMVDDFSRRSWAGDIKEYDVVMEKFWEELRSSQYWTIYYNSCFNKYSSGN